MTAEYDRSCWSVGQTVFVRRFTLRNLHDLSEEAIVKVGKKWVYLRGNCRFDMKTGEIDGRGFSSPGRVYLTAREYKVDVEKAALWRKIRDTIGWLAMPAHFTLDTLQRIARDLDIKKDEERK